MKTENESKHENEMLEKRTFSLTQHCGSFEIVGYICVCMVIYDVQFNWDVESMWRNTISLFSIIGSNKNCKGTIDTLRFL